METSIEIRSRVSIVPRRPGPFPACPAAAESDSHVRSLWAVVLAGGDGTRLTPLVRRLHADERPKQFVAIVGSRSLLRGTLDRIGALIPSERIVVVGNRTHRALLSAEVSEFPAATVLLQPGNRGTGPGVLFPVSWIARHDPRATVAVFPSDHFILGGNAFIAHVAQARAFVDLHPEWILLVGAPATRPETEFGWIEAGERVGATASGPICRVRRFREKPDRDEARRCLRTGCLWNTFVMVGRASAMLEAAKAASRPVLEACEHAARASCACNADALDEIYAPLPTLDFSRAILEQSTDRLVVSRLPAGIWSDLGTPQRVLRSLTEADMPIPEWMGRGENATGRPVDPVEGVPA